MLRKTPLLCSRPFPQIKCLFLSFQESLCFEAMPHYAQVAHPVSHSRDFSWQKSLRIAHPWESPSSYIFQAETNAHKKCTCIGNLECSGCVRTSAHSTQVTKVFAARQRCPGWTEFAVHAQIVAHKNWMISHRWAIVTTPALLCWGLAGCQLPLSSCFWELLARRDGWKELPQQQRAQRTTTAVIGTSKNSQLPGFWLNSLPTGYFWRYIISQPFCCVF